MKAIIGLGNPGKKYERTRHNAGFMVIDELCRRYNVSSMREKFHAEIAEIRVTNEKVILMKPLTFMNLSGQALQSVAHFYPEIRKSEDIIVIYDDMDFQPGQVKLRATGRAGGHNGIKSLIEVIGGTEFPRVRVGVGRPMPGVDVVSFVLGQFASEEKRAVEAAIGRAADAVEDALKKGFAHAMNQFNAMS